MSKKCIHCGHLVHEEFCPRCGQKVHVERITLRYILEEIIHFFTHAEKGFFYTSAQAIKVPGKLVTNYIRGDRLNYQPPVSYFLIWNAILLLVIYLSRRFFGENEAVDFGEYFGAGGATNVAISHLNVLLATLLPLQALYLWLVVVYRQYNYFEALVVMLYGIGTILLGQAAFVLLAIIYHLITGNSLNIQLSDILKVVIMSWMIFDLVKFLPVKHKTVKALVFLVLALGSFTAWRLLVFPEIAKWFF